MTAPILHGGGITAVAQRYGGDPKDWLDLSTGINPNPVALPDIDPQVWHRLPDRHLLDAARLAASRYYGSGKGMPLPVPGTQSAIQLLPKLVASGRRAAIFSPAYGEYERVMRSAGIAVDRVSGIDDLRHDHSLVIVVNPNNPDGRVLEREQLMALYRRVDRHGGRLLIDEAFADCTPQTSLATEAQAMPGLILFRSFGKFFGLAGLRLGFVIALPDILAAFEEWLGPWAVSGPALFVAEKLMRGDIATLRKQIAMRRAALAEVLTAAGLEVIGGTSLFALVNCDASAQLREHLCLRHILVRQFDYKEGWLRFGLTADSVADARLHHALMDWKAA